ncbi:DUF4097 domain-containing protein [Streptomyces sp. NBC_01317]|uniref:DUF4097 family beta strand repeat-containing protein n=1 Tax=Streptomyces sp. NBC_01317 TaxID=2903822 RepID=UPI002E0F1E77|nr:DUF4097 domain-containing protein [Streptomyces sp. NBC_01317]
MDVFHDRANRRGRSGVRALLALGGAALLALAVTGCGSGSDASDAPVEHRSFAFSGKKLTIDAGNSSVTLVPADVKTVDVTRQVDGWVFMGSGPDAEWRMSGGTLTLRVKCDAVASDCEGQHRVKVPRGVAVSVEADSGKVLATGFDTALSLVARNGSVTVRDSSGTLDLGSDNGKIVAEDVSARTVSAKADNGSIHLALTTVPDSVDTSSDNGKIVIDLPRSKASYAVTADSDNGKADVDVPTDRNSTHVVKARSDNGQVTVRSAN